MTCGYDYVQVKLLGDLFTVWLWRIISVFFTYFFFQPSWL